jgi:hypothetical protein
MKGCLRAAPVRGRPGRRAAGGDNGERPRGEQAVGRTVTCLPGPMAANYFIGTTQPED